MAMVQRRLLRLAAALLGGSTMGPQTASAQVCRATGANIIGCSSKAALQVAVPFAKSALWAAEQVPANCDEQTPNCNWRGAGDAWRYSLNNLRLAFEHASDADKEWLPLDQVKQLQGFVAQLGHDPGLWAGNWPNQLVSFARQLLEQLAPWAGDAALQPMPMPRSDTGTRFPTLGRSVAVSSDGDMAASVTLANGFAMPVLGFGTWQLPPDGTTYRSVKWALELGYRHIDTAQGYGNEHEVGDAIRDSAVPRSEICLVTKLSNLQEYPMARQRFEQQLQLMGVEYIDVYMLHSPGGSKEARQEAWRQMEELYDEGKIKALGVSNFNVDLLQELLGFARIRPVYIQNKYSIYAPGGGDEALNEDSLMEWLSREKIVMTGYSIIHPAHGGYLSPLGDPLVAAIAKRHRRTPSQVLHRWLLQLGGAVIPRSTNFDRIRENGDLFRFMLTESDMRLLNGIASLVKSNPGQVSPVWCADVYGLGSL